MRQAAAVLITAAVIVLTLTSSTTARAQSSAFNGPQATGVMVGAGLLTGIVCWTVELANAESRYDDAPRVIREDDYERTGWFVGAKAVSATEFLDEAEEQKNIEGIFAPLEVKFDMSNSSTSAGISVNGGRRCHERFAIEIDLEWVDDFDGTITQVNTGNITQKIRFAPVVTTLNVKGYVLTGRYQPYGLLGVGVMAIDTVTTSATGNTSHQTTGVLALRFGGGLDYYLTRSWVLNVEASYVLSATDIDTLDWFSVGLGVGYRF